MADSCCGLVGGTASRLGGGKFANGAQTAAMQYLFNQATSNDDDGNPMDDEVDGATIGSGSTVEEVDGIKVHKIGRFGMTPVGRKGSPINTTVKNSPTTVDGTKFTGHSLDRMQERGITPSVVKDTIKTGIATSGRGGAKIYTNDQLRVVVNPNGSIKTVYPQ